MPFLIKKNLCFDVLKKLHATGYHKLKVILGIYNIEDYFIKIKF